MIEVIRKQIYKDSGVLVVPSNTTAKMPPLPFATINTTSPHIKDVGQADIHIVEDAEGIKRRRSESYQFVFSINVYATTDTEAIRLAKVVRSWFFLAGETHLEDMNIVVTNLRNVENRTTFLVDSYEYRHGFDVQLRGSDDQTFNRVHQDGTNVHYDWIETVELEFEGVNVE